MAIHPKAITADGVEVWHEERGHGGVVPWGAIGYAAPTRIVDGALRAVPDREAIVLPCPVAGCGSSSLIPRAGGAHPDEGRALHEAFAARAGG